MSESSDGGSGGGSSSDAGGSAGSGGEITADGSGGASSDTDGMGGSSSGSSSDGTSLGGQGGAPAEDLACQQDLAFAAVSGAFVGPTPFELALALNQVAYDTSVISFVLRGAADDPTLTASYTLVQDGEHMFPKVLEPSSAPAWVSDSGFGSTSSQQQGWMLVSIDSGPLEIPLRNIRVTASTESGCTRGVAVVTAVIPGEDADVVDELVPSSEPAGGEERGTAADITIRALFDIETVPFKGMVQ